MDEKKVLIEALTEYIKWFGKREAKIDKLIEVSKQSRDVNLAMLLKEELNRKLFTLLALTLLVTSCEVEPPCECQEQTYSYVYDIPSGTRDKINVEFESAGCTDEVPETELPNDSDDASLVRYYNITCN